MAILLLVILVCLAIWYYKFGGKKFGIPNNLKRKISIGNKSSESTSGGNPRSFENPYFNQEVTMSNLQVKVSDLKAHLDSSKDTMYTKLALMP